MTPEPSIIDVAETDSTNDEARRRLAAVGAGPVWVRADRQSAGRGRRGRAWSSLEGNLFLSGAFRLSCPPSEAAQLAFAAALAVGELLDARVEPARVAYKWPNDVLVGGAKIAGILLEANQAGRGLELVVGIGVNLAAAPADATYAATSLAAEGVDPPAPAAAGRVVARSFEKWRDVWAGEGFAPIRTRWLARAHGLGERVTAQAPEGTASGVFEDLDGEGALVMSGPEGRRTIRSGEVFFGAGEEAR